MSMENLARKRGFASSPRQIRMIWEPIAPMVIKEGDAKLIRDSFSFSAVIRDSGWAPGHITIPKESAVVPHGPL